MLGRHENGSTARAVPPGSTGKARESASARRVNSALATGTFGRGDVPGRRKACDGARLAAWHLFYPRCSRCSTRAPPAHTPGGAVSPWAYSLSLSGRPARLLSSRIFSFTVE